MSPINCITTEFSLKDDIELSRGNISATLSQLDERIRNGEKITLEDAKAASGYGDYGAEVLAGAVNNAEGQTFSQVKGDMHNAYLAGRVNKGMRFETDLQREAYYAGKKDAELGRLIAKKKAGYTTVYGEESGFIPNDASKNVSPKMQKALNLVAKDLGVKVMFADNIFVNKKGDQANAAMGDDGIFRISANSTQPLYELIIHEPFHRMRQLATQEYFDAMNFAVQHAEQLGLRLEQGNGAGTYYEALNNLFAEKGISHDDAKILDELAAQFYQKIVSNDADALRFIQEMNKTEKSRNALEKFMDYVKELIGKLQKVVRKLRNQGEYAAAKQMDMTIKELETARKFYLNAYRATRQRVENRRVEQTWDVTEESQTEKNTTAVGDVSYSLREEFLQEIDEWEREGKPDGESFVLGTTGDVLQGLGAIESDIYMLGDKINEILSRHPEMSIEEIKKIPQILENPVLILKSRNLGREDKQNTRLVIFGTAKAQNGKPILAVLDLKPIEKNLVIDDMQKVSSAYSKTSHAVEFVRSSDVLYAEKNKTAKLLRTIGFLAPIELQQSGFIGSISYKGQNVNIEGEKFKNVFSERDSSIKEVNLSLKDEVEVSPRRTKELLDTIAYLKGQFETTKFAKADPQKLRSMTRKLLKEYSSNLNLGEMTTAMDELYRYMANGEGGHPAAWDETFRRAKEIATRIAESALETDVLYVVNAKKKNRSSNEAGFTDKSAPLIKGSSEISIANLLELVKNDSSY